LPRKWDGCCFGHCFCRGPTPAMIDGFEQQFWHNIA